QRIGGGKIVAEGFILAVIEQVGKPCTRINAEVLAALWANVQVFFEVLFPDDLTAALALHPQPFGPDFLLARSIQIARLSFKPGHVYRGERMICSSGEITIARWPDHPINTRSLSVPARPSRRRVSPGASRLPYRQARQLSDVRCVPSRSHAPFPASA